MKSVRLLGVAAILSGFPLALLVAARLFMSGTHPTAIILFLLTVFIALMIWAMELDRSRAAKHHDLER